MRCAMLGRLARWIDERLELTGFARSALRKVFPNHWSFLLGEIALYSFVVLVVTGLFLVFFFDPSTTPVVYEGGYEPLRGVEMSAAYESAVELSLDVRSGLVMRQTHHWAGLVFVASIVAHLCRIFFTGAFRKPREINWFVGVTMLVLALANGFAGYSLLDDLLSGTGLRIAYSIALSIPLVGAWVAFAVFGGEFPATDIITRLFVIHVLVIPVLLAGLIGVHLAILWRQRHTQYAGPGRRDDNVVGTRLWPIYAAKSLGLALVVAGVLVALGGLVQINPVWLYGPFEPSAVTTAAQPDWYLGWLEGALRIFGPWDVELFGVTISEVFWPGVLLPTVLFGSLYAWPLVDRRITGDDAAHHVLERPRDRPGRTALGVATLTFCAVLLLAGSQDIVAQQLDLSIADVLWAFRVLVVVLPVAAAAVTYKLCRDLAAEAHPRGGAGSVEGASPRDPSAAGRFARARPASGSIR